MQKNNLLYLFADQWRYHAIGAAGADPVKTPAMDAFAGESAVCTNAFSTYPLCSPHRAALLTGKNPLECGMWTNCKEGLDVSPCLAPQETLISDVLKKSGYRTAYIGKWHLDSSDRNYFPNTECREWDAYTPTGERRHGFDFWYSYGAMDNHLVPHYWNTEGKKITVNQWSAEHETDVLLDYLESGKKTNTPFCAFVSWNPPHPPYNLIPQNLVDEYTKAFTGEPDFRQNVPQQLRESAEFLQKRQQYFAAVGGLDKQFGRIIDYLKKTGLWKNTLVVLSSDHGDCMGSHGLYGKNIWYEESIHIPLYIGGAGIKPAICDSFVESCDHMPTLLELLDEEIPATVTGKSVANALRGKKQDKKEAAFLCMLPGMPDLVQAFKKVGIDSKCFGWRGVRTKTHTYIVDNGSVPHTKQKRWLYDLECDPYQLSPEEVFSGDKRYEHYEKLLSSWCEENKDYFLWEPLKIAT